MKKFQVGDGILPCIGGLSVALVFTALAGCEENPAEEAVDTVEDAGEEVSDTVDDAADEIDT